MLPKIGDGLELITEDCHLSSLPQPDLVQAESKALMDSIDGLTKLGNDCAEAIDAVAGQSFSLFLAQHIGQECFLFARYRRAIRCKIMCSNHNEALLIVDHPEGQAEVNWTTDGVGDLLRSHPVYYALQAITSSGDRWDWCDTEDFLEHYVPDENTED